MLHIYVIYLYISSTPGAWPRGPERLVEWACLDLGQLRGRLPSTLPHPGIRIINQQSSSRRGVA